MKPNNVTQSVAIAIGAAIVFILMKFVVIPTPIPNTSVHTAYGFLALLAAVFGPLVAGLAALIGHALNDALTYGTIWYSWVVTSGLVGFSLGLLLHRTGIHQGLINRALMMRYLIGQAVIAFVCWGGVAPGLDILIHSEPANKVFAQGILSAVLNSLVTGILGWILIRSYAKTRTKTKSLYKEQ